MKIHILKSKSGFTLMELIISIALLGLVTSMVFSLFGFGRKVLDVSSKEYKLQASTRLTLANTSNIIRYSTAVFTIPGSSFREDNLDAGWDYIGIHEVEISPAHGGNPAVMGEEIVQYTYDKINNTHDSKVLIAADPDISFKFVFTKVNPHDEDSLLRFTLKSCNNHVMDAFGNPSETIVLTSEVESLNSLQVIDLSTATDPAAAIAYRSQERVRTVVGHVAMVLDTSGSMADALNGHSPGGSNGSSRISILRTRATELVNKFAQEDNIDIALVPFSDSANGIHTFYNAKTKTSSLTGIISGSELNAGGGTNTGDGLRRAYWALKAHNAEVGSGVTPSNYVIILVDGVTTFYSVRSASDRSYVTNDQDVDEGYLDRGWGEYDPDGQIAGNGSTLDTGGTAYVNAIGAMLNSGAYAKAYVIGFSSLSSELHSVQDIADACGAPSGRVYTANSSDALNLCFEDIRQDIVNDLWYLQGPDL